MPSITYWNRLEPRPRDADIRTSLAARVRDPLWFLTRQWQLGELRAEDAGSVAYATIRAREVPITTWKATDGPTHSLPSNGLLEADALAEPFAVDLALRIELGLELERIIPDSEAAARQILRDAFPIATGGDEPELRALWHGRVADGVSVCEATAPPAAAGANAATWMQALRDYVTRIYGQLATSDPEGWRPDRLDYDLEVMADGVAFAMHPDRQGDIAWYSFDTRSGTSQAQATILQEVIPGRAAFRGMPNARFWQFESGAFVPGDVRPEKRDLAALILIDYALVHANDWYVVPFEQSVGSICAIDDLMIRDTFGDDHGVRRTDENASTGPQRWTMFSLVDDQLRPAPWFLVPPAGLPASGRILEDTRFFRDEMANMVWAVEHTLQDTRGEPSSGYERAVQERTPESQLPSSAALRYRIQTDVPTHWIPFVPVVIDDSLRQIALERAAMLRTVPGGAAEPILPSGRILLPRALGDAPLRIREEEVPREGTRVVRTARRARTSDGGTCLWITRARSIGAGEGASQLKFDIARAED
jgi:hypothetical protein